MKVSQILGAAGLGVLLCGPLAAQQASAAVQTSAAAIQIDDDTLESNVEATLKRDSILAPRHIDAEAKNGVVTLTGTVPTTADKERAGSLAKIAGVNAVVNQIEVDPRVDQSKTDAAADKTKAGLDKAVDATAKGAKKTAEGVEKGRRRNRERDWQGGRQDRGRARQDRRQDERHVDDHSREDRVYERASAEGFGD